MATSTIASEVAKRHRGAQPREKLTMVDDLLVPIKAEIERSSRVVFPSPRYQQDPVAFAREILGVDPWDKQVEILESIRDHTRVAVKSGHKVSKSHSAAIIALWFFCSFPDARVVMTSTTARQVDQILWRELRMMRARSGRCVDCKREDPDGHRITRPCQHSSIIEGEMGELARTGIKTSDFREVVGFTAREAEAVAGISGRNLLYIADEASGIPEEIFEAIEGNRAGGARIVMFSNPTRTSGEFYEAFTSKKEFYHCITISSESTPNCVEGRLVIPGLATREWVEEKALEWGRESPMFKVRILGEFALSEDGRIFSIHAIEQAEQRWYDAPDAGRLYIGIDPAGPSGSGDETVFCARRGMKALQLRAHRGLTAEGHLVHLLGAISTLKLPRETPVVVLDREGSVGAELFGMLRGHVEANPASFELVGVRASDRAVRQPQIYDRLRDELTANLESWFRDGGAIPEDARLSAELHLLEWKQQANGRLKVTPKDAIRKALGRSPDRYDALALAAWEPLALRDEVEVSPAARAAAVDSFDYGSGALDPYAGANAWGRR